MFHFLLKRRPWWHEFPPCENSLQEPSRRVIRLVCILTWLYKLPMTPDVKRVLGKKGGNGDHRILVPGIFGNCMSLYLGYIGCITWSSGFKSEGFLHYFSLHKKPYLYPLGGAIPFLSDIRIFRQFQLPGPTWFRILVVVFGVKVKYLYKARTESVWIEAVVRYQLKPQNLGRPTEMEGVQHLPVPTTSINIQSSW